MFRRLNECELLEAFVKEDFNSEYAPSIQQACLQLYGIVRDKNLYIAPIILGPNRLGILKPRSTLVRHA